MAELKPKKFGYVVHPPAPPKFNVPPPAPPGISTTDWIAYINSYIDVRARQLYDKLKSLYNQQIENNDDVVHEHILLKDHTTNGAKKLFISGDSIFTDDYIVTPKDVDGIIEEDGSDKS